MLTRDNPIELAIPFVAKQPIIVSFKARKMNGIGSGRDVKIGINYVVYYKKGNIFLEESGAQYITVGDLEQGYKLRLISPDGSGIYSNKNIKITKNSVYIALHSDNLNAEVDISGLWAGREQDFNSAIQDWAKPVIDGVARRIGGIGGMGGGISIGINKSDIALDYVLGRIDVSAMRRDQVNRVWYIRPWANDSFGVVAHNHIISIRNNIAERQRAGFEKSSFEIVDIDWPYVSTIDGSERRSILIHPFLYPFAHDYNRNMESLIKLFRMRWKLGGFDVCDSDRLSTLAVSLINRLDLIIVPSLFSRDACIGSGVKSDIVQVVGHGIGHEFEKTELGNDMGTMNADLNMLYEMKRNGSILVLFFLIHSDWRKGADLVGEVMRRVQGKGKNVVLVVKSDCDIVKTFPGVRCAKIRGWLNNDDLRRLYDTCDILVSPSRGGGFELNALEAISRGVVTLVTGGGCFTDLMNYYIGINVGRLVQPLIGNPIHVGLGPECDINDFERKLEDAIVRLDEWKKVFKDRSKEIRERYTWKKVGIQLENILKQYDFVR